jgi:ABC-type nitrate/sulfonate/bicarbonate transport system permease component
MWMALGLAILGVLWWATANYRWIDPLLLPAPAAVFGEFVRLLHEGRLTHDMAQTVWRFAVALVIAGSVGIGAGLWLGYRRDLYAVVAGLLHGARSLPAIAWFPLFLLFVGTNARSICFLGIFSSLPVFLLATVSGVERANPRRVDQARRLGLRGFRLVRSVLFWEALPHILSGARIAVGYCLAVIVAGEMFLGVVTDGVGFRIYDTQSRFQSATVFAYMVAAAAIGLLLNLLLGLLTSFLLRWQPKSLHAPL